MIRKRFLPALLLACCLAAPSPAQTVIGPAGVYTVQTAGSTKVEYGDGWVKISWANDPAPNPGPTPNPTPDPTPVPIPTPVPPPTPVATGKIWASLVYDAATETQAQASMRADLAASQEWAGLNVRFLAIEKSQKILDDTGLRRYATAAPCVLVQEAKDGSKVAPVIKTLDQPTAAAAVIDAIKDLRGVKK